MQKFIDHYSVCRVLMNHLSDNWETVSGSLDKKMLQQTLMTFMRTNEEMSQGRNSGEWGQMTTVCEVSQDYVRVCYYQITRIHS